MFGMGDAQHTAQMASNPVLKEDLYPAVAETHDMRRMVNFTNPEGMRRWERMHYSDNVDSTSHYFRMIEREKKFRGISENRENRQELSTPTPNGRNHKRFTK